MKIFKSFIWLTVVSILLLIVYWNIHYAQIIIENQNFPQIGGYFLILGGQFVTIFFSIKFISNAIKNL